MLQGRRLSQKLVLTALRQCKGRKIKCGEQKPICENCEKTGQICDYSIKLNWDGRTKRKGGLENHLTVHTLRNPSQIQRQSSNTPTIDLEQRQPHEFPSLHHSQSFNKPLLATPPSVVGAAGLLDAADVRPTANATLPPITSYAKSREEKSSPYPSPAASNLDDSLMAGSKRCLFHAILPPLSPSDMPPPQQNSPLRMMAASATHVDSGHKRARLSPPMSSNSDLHHQSTSQETIRMRVGAFPSTVRWPPQSLSRHSNCTPVNGISPVPSSPAPSSTGSGESHQSRTRPSFLPQQDRRMSIESLISGSSYTRSASESAVLGHVRNCSDSSFQTSYYGVDSGYPDFDVPSNNDQEALNDTASSFSATPFSTTSLGAASENQHYTLKSPVDTSYHLRRRQPFYNIPIEVKIPEDFEPLPPILLHQPMNLLYFHHFISHTGRILVPHDCSGNPFRKILPKSRSSYLFFSAFTNYCHLVALKDDNLLRLLLAYSASHRARLMEYTEPRTRIGQYMENVFSTLSTALADPHTQISNSTFATSIMLASLEIISPNPFGTKTTISWETHLSMTRKIIFERGIREKTVDRNDEESYFLTRWFAYLDVLGSLSNSQKGLPLFKGDFWANDFADNSQDYRIDCFFGFTNRCVCILADMAELARTCDKERVTTPSADTWEPSPTSFNHAKRIRTNLMDSMQQPYQGCQHGRHPSAQHDESTTHALELTTTNDAYHWAGLIYLNRRVLRKSPEDEQIQDFVNIILVGLGKLTQGGTAEACNLFPMFIAGCEALEEGCRRKFLDRLRSVERTGMTQAYTARRVMQRVWQEGRPWEEIIDGGFIG